jgi:hypothetical protein
LDVARTFGISVNVADKLLKVKPGDPLTEGALVAEASGFMARSIKAPRPGRVMVAGGGQVLMEVGDARIELRPGHEVVSYEQDGTGVAALTKSGV